MFAELLQESGLSLDRLQSFCLVAEAGAITKAAQGDPTKQSQYSRQIKELEEFFGTELVRRKGRGIALTPAGERLNTLARECFASMLDFKHECRSLPVEIVIGTGDSLIQWLLMPRLDKIREQIPNVRFKFLNLPTADAVNRLADGVIDFALVRKDAVTRPLKSQSLGTLAYALFIPVALQPPTHKHSARLLGGLPLATLEGEGSFRRALAQAAGKAGVKLNIQLECSSFPLAARAVAKGNLAAILPAIAETDLPATVAAQVPVPWLNSFAREMCLATNPRLLRIRPILQQAATALTLSCHF